MTLISNKKNQGVKREKRINFFVNSTYKMNVFTQLYNDNTNIYMFMKKR